MTLFMDQLYHRWYKPWRILPLVGTGIGILLKPAVRLMTAGQTSFRPSVESTSAVIPISPPSGKPFRRKPAYPTEYAGCYTADDAVDIAIGNELLDGHRLSNLRCWATQQPCFQRDREN